MRNQKIVSVVLSVTLSFLGVAVIAYGATTIGTAITTSGDLSVTGTGLTTLVNASTTRLSVSTGLWINGNATTTLQGVVVPTARTAAPTCGAAEEGGWAYDNVKKVACICIGTAWKQATTSTGVATCF